MLEVVTTNSKKVGCLMFTGRIVELFHSTWYNYRGVVYSSVKCLFISNKSKRKNHIHHTVDKWRLTNDWNKIFSFADWWMALLTKNKENRHQWMDGLVKLKSLYWITLSNLLRTKWHKKSHWKPKSPTFWRLDLNSHKKHTKVMHLFLLCLLSWTNVF